jgi:hypothetical protein
VPNPDRGELIPMAAGERIVAFARPGKPPEIAILPLVGFAFRAVRTFMTLEGSQQFLKACWAIQEPPEA